MYIIKNRLHIFKIIEFFNIFFDKFKNSIRDKVPKTIKL